MTALVYELRQEAESTDHAKDTRRLLREADDAICVLLNALASASPAPACASCAELAETRRALLASEEYRRRYMLGKYELYALGGAVQDAAMAHLPCSEGPLESWVRWHLLLPQHRMVVDDLHATARALEAAEALQQSQAQEIARFREALGAFKRGDCWCEMGIGNPMITSHSAACVEAAALLKGQP